ncbi:MAG: hypothetical protein QOH36_341 [Actinomycetota bacterium]|jgi:hypothetical protein|nr:hypothetical protein [Actinomycetota bacterium]MEA2972554.1 hypothetical protein [Actinomycetota bacterium]
MDLVSGILGIVLFLATPAIVVGGVAALIGKAAGARPVRVFWIAFVITVALEIILIGLCFAALSDVG